MGASKHLFCAGAIALSLAMGASACSWDGQAAHDTVPVPKPPSSPWPGTRPAQVPQAPSLTGSGALYGPATPTPHVKLPHRPNVVMITTDDMSVTDMPYMPHVRQLLVRQGTTMGNAIAPTSICVPARASLISGQYATNHGAYTIQGQHGGMKAFSEADTLPVWLHKAGYRTYFTGKYLNGYGDPGTNQRYIPPGWDDWRGTVGMSTYNFSGPQFNLNGTLVQTHTYSTDTIREQSLQQLQEQQRQHPRQPFFMWVNYVAPHVGSAGPADDTLHQFHNPANQLTTTSPAPSDRGRFDGIKLPRLPNMFKAPYGAPPNSPTLRRTWDRGGREALRISFQRRIEALQDVDRSVAATVAELRATGQLKKTLIIFASDNGYVVGEHNISGKLWEYNDILRIPMVLRGPGVPRDKVMKTMVSNPDVATTIAALARARPGRPQDGVDFFPWLHTGYRVRVIPIIAWPLHDGLNRSPQYSGVRVGPWTYIRYHRGGEEMYDRVTDPYELYNLAIDHRYRQQLLELRALTREYVYCKGDTCPKAFYAPPKTQS